MVRRREDVGTLFSLDLLMIGKLKMKRGSFLGLDRKIRQWR